MQIVEKKLSFQVKDVVEVGTVQTNFIANCSVNFEALTYKVDPVITTQHGDEDDFFDIVSEVARVAVAECQKKLDAYREKMGFGKQGELYNQPAEHENQVRAAA